MIQLLLPMHVSPVFAFKCTFDAALVQKQILLQPLLTFAKFGLHRSTGNHILHARSMVKLICIAHILMLKLWLYTTYVALGKQPVDPSWTACLILCVQLLHHLLQKLTVQQTGHVVGVLAHGLVQMRHFQQKDCPKVLQR